jgi:hypothetical protein
MIPAAKLLWNREFTKTEAPITNQNNQHDQQTRGDRPHLATKQPGPTRASQVRLQMSNGLLSLPAVVGESLRN